MKDRYLIKAIIAEDVLAPAEVMAEICKKQDVIARRTARGQDLLKMLTEDSIDILLLDLGLKDSDEANLLYFFHEARQISPDTQIIIITSKSTTDRAFRAARDGAYNFIEKGDGGFERLEISLRNLVERIRDKRQLVALQAGKGSVRKFISQSSEIAAILDKAKQIAALSDPVLITGETGVGKDVIADYIYSHSRINDCPFVKINCGAVPAERIEAELFGWTKDSFPGAKEHQGVFQQADEGTLFLDEIGDMPLNVQIKLLRAIDQGEIQRVGSDRIEKVKVRIISATNKDFDSLVSEGTFRSDFFYRINTFQIQIPPLRQRNEDIPLIALFTLERYIKKEGLPHKEFDTAALARLKEHNWDAGNVRHLKKVVKNLAAFTPGSYITDLHVDAELNGTQKAALSSDDLPLPKRLERYEISILKETLRKHDGNRTHAAAELGIHRVTLQEKLAKYGLLNC